MYYRYTRIHGKKRNGHKMMHISLLTIENWKTTQQIENKSNTLQRANTSSGSHFLFSIGWDDDDDNDQCAVDFNDAIATFIRFSNLTSHSINEKISTEEIVVNVLCVWLKPFYSEICSRNTPSSNQIELMCSSQWLHTKTCTLFLLIFAEDVACIYFVYEHLWLYACKIINDAASKCGSVKMIK